MSQPKHPLPHSSGRERTHRKPPQYPVHSQPTHQNVPRLPPQMTTNVPIPPYIPAYPIEARTAPQFFPSNVDHIPDGLPFSPRPNPYSFSSLIYINAVPPDMPEGNLAEALRECMPVRIRLDDAVNGNERLMPNAYYDWMSRTGTLEFQTPKSAEKAMAILPGHPYLLTTAAYVSPFPPPEPLPFSNPPVATRYIRPTKLVHPAVLPAEHTPADDLMSKCPTPGQLYDAFRPWGSLRSVAVWVEDLKPGDEDKASKSKNLAGQGPLRWRAKVEFWYEDEARRFDVGWGQTGSLLKGWQLGIILGAPEPVLPPHLLPLSIPSTSAYPSIPQNHLPPTPTSMTSFEKPASFTPQTLQNYMGLTYVPNGDFLSNLPPSPSLNLPPMPGFGLGQRPPLTPQSPNGFHPPPWAEHNLYAGAGYGNENCHMFDNSVQGCGFHNPQFPGPSGSFADPYQHYNQPFSFPSQPLPPPNMVPASVRCRASTSLPSPTGSFPSNVTGGGSGSRRNSKVSGMGGGRRHSLASSAASNIRHRTWSVSVGEAADGTVRPVGYVADDGMVIQHGPGQHIRPSPLFGPGSTSISGLVDLSNVFVKNLDPDISSYFLSELFQNLGNVVSARVMRDESGRNRGYGFVSFVTPEEAAYAIKVMNGTRVGNQIISVTLHEPRKLRPEKIAERVALGLPLVPPVRNARTRSSNSPIRVARGGLGRRPEIPNVAPPPAATDEIRLLSPPSRRFALAERIDARVKAVAKYQSMPNAMVLPTINALVSHDLGLIPLLHDQAGLDAKIVETLSLVSNSVDQTSNDKLPDGNQTTHERLVAKINKIDEELAENIAALLIKSLPAAEISCCLTDNNVLDRNCALAKRTISRRRQKDLEEVDDREVTNSSELDSGSGDLSSSSTDLSSLGIDDMISADNAASPAGLPTSKVVNTEHSGSSPILAPSARDSPASPSSAKVPVTVLEPGDITVKNLSSLSLTDILHNVRSSNPETVCETLGVPRPTALEIGTLVNWSEGVLKAGRSGSERRMDIIKKIAEKVEMPDMKRTKKLLVIGDLLNSEDDDRAACELLKYPALLEGRIRSFVAERDRKLSDSIQK